MTVRQAIEEARAEEMRKAVIHAEIYEVWFQTKVMLAGIEKEERYQKLLEKEVMDTKKTEIFGETYAEIYVKPDREK